MGSTESILAGDVASDSLPTENLETRKRVQTRRINDNQNHTQSVTGSRSHILRKNHNKKILKEGKRNFSYSTESVIELRGCILGSPRTGKTSLFRRLCGKDPFRTAKNETIIDEEIGTSQTISWTGEDRISKASVILNDGKLADTNHKELDFVILCIDPMRPETFEDAKKLTEHLLQLQPQQIKNRNGSGVKENESKNDNDDIEQKGKYGHTQSLSICFMLNFKDLFSSIDQTNSNSITFETLQTFVAKLHLQLRPTTSIQKKANTISTSLPPKYQLYALESSMKNCYGLLPLHNFIQIPYHNRKESILQNQLLQLAANRMKACTRLQKVLQQQDYGRFLDILSNSNFSQPNEKGKRISQNQERSNKDNSVISHSPITKSKVSQIKDEAILIDKNSQDNLALNQARSASKLQNSSTKTFQNRSLTHDVSKTSGHESFQKPMRIYDPNQTLEDFFADDDDDDGNMKSVAAGKNKSSLTNHRQHQINDNKDDDDIANDDDDDDEDDFYYDLEGRKIQTLGKRQSHSAAQKILEKIEMNNANTLKSEENSTNSTTTTELKQTLLKTEIEKEEKTFKTEEVELQNCNANTTKGSRHQKTKNISGRKGMNNSDETLLDEKKEIDINSASGIPIDNRYHREKEVNGPNKISDFKNLDLSEQINDNSLSEFVEQDDNIDGWSDEESIGLILGDDEEENEDEPHDMNEPVIAKTNINTEGSSITYPNASVNNPGTKLNESEVINDIDGRPRKQNEKNEKIEKIEINKDSNPSEGWSDDDEDVGFILEQEMAENNHYHDVDDSNEMENMHAMHNESKLNVPPTMSKAALAAIASAEKELIASFAKEDDAGKVEKKKKKKKKKIKSKNNPDKLQKKGKEKKK